MASSLLSKFSVFAFFACFLLLAGCVSQPAPIASAVPSTIPSAMPTIFATPTPSVAAVQSHPFINTEPIQAHFEAGEIARLCGEQVNKSKAALDAIAALPKDRQPTALFEFETAIADFNDVLTPLYFMGYAYPDANVSAEASGCEVKYYQFLVDAYTRKDVYDIIKKFPQTGRDEGRLYNKTIEQFEHYGLNLPKEKLDAIRVLKMNLSAIEAKFTANLNSDNTTIIFSKEELDGAPEDFLNRLEKTADGKYVVTMKYPDYDAVMNLKNNETRKRMRFAFNNHGAPVENTLLLEDALLVRQQIANLSGYANWVDYQTSTRMAKNESTVEALISALKPGAVESSRAHIAALLAYKRTIEPNATSVERWDVGYLEGQITQKQYALDSGLVSEYFPLDSTVEGMFSIFSGVFGVRFEQVANATTWHQDVRLYRIVDPATNASLAYFYFDPFPRNGKYSHNALVPLVFGRMVNGSYNAPVAAILANQNPADAGKPALMSHSEVETLFHEFGHVLQVTLTRAPYASLSGLNVAWDFAEMSSQTLQGWAWEPQVIDAISSNYKDGSKMPVEMRDKILAAHSFSAGYDFANVLDVSDFDLKIHKAHGPVNTTAVSDALDREYLGLTPQEGTHFPATFLQLMGGYDAGIYGFIWSDVFSQDCFAQFQKEGLFNATTGARYRKWIFEKGNMEDGDKLLEGFLGRPANTDAYYKKLNITVKAG